MIEIPELAVGGLAAGTLSAFVLGGGLLRARRERAGHRAEIRSLRSELDASRGELDRAGAAFAAEIEHLARTRLPAEATRSAHPHVRVPGPLGPAGAGTDAVLDALREAVVAERKRVDAAARAGMRGTTREIQAALYRLQDVLRGLQQRYDDPELAQTLYALDHENEQSLRRAQVAAVVCGAWVGLAREESHLVDAVTGGQARLVGYHRVQVLHHLEPGTALVSHAVEPVAIIVAELLDNALRHSSPDTSVVVGLERAHHGVTVTVDDAGVGMAPDERERAQRMVAGRDPIMLSELGDPPRMGLAAIGQLTRQFDLSVDLSSPSPYGGVRAVLLIKNHLLCTVDPALRPHSAGAAPSTRQAAGHEPRPDRAQPDEEVRQHPAAPARQAAAPPPGVPSAGAPSAGAAPGVPSADGDLLPQRRRRVPVQGAQAGRSVPAPRIPARSPEESAAALGALQSATNAARQAAATEGNDPR